jgi:TolB-like protein
MLSADAGQIDAYGGPSMNIILPALQGLSESPFPAPPPDTWTHAEVRDELSRILRSRFFIKSARLSSFLSTAVDYLLAGKASSFKEFTVGTEVYGRSTEYDPTQDTIVRTEARRLRSKLKEYYANLARPHRLRITLVSGSYVPVIEIAHASPHDESFEPDFPVLHAGDDGSLSLAVLSFNAKAVEPGNQDIANSLEEELTHELAHNSDLKVFRMSADWPSWHANQSSHWSRSGIQFALRGYVGQSDKGPIAQLQLTTIQGMILWSERFGGESLQSRANEIASAVCSAFLNSAAPRSRGRSSTANFHNQGIAAVMATSISHASELDGEGRLPFAERTPERPVLSV